jgi:starch synthase (maltosyl-transferring)
MPVPRCRSRVVVENVEPQLDGGRFAIKRVIGEAVVVEADLLADGHDEISASLLYRKEGASDWTSVPMTSLGNDRWTGTFTPMEIGAFRYSVRGWIDHFKTWRRDLVKRYKAGQEIDLELLVGAELLTQAAGRATARDAVKLKQFASFLSSKMPTSERFARIMDDDVSQLIGRYPDLHAAGHADQELPLWVDRERARFSTWYELFPRSCSPEPGEHGTLRDVTALLPRIASMGFDILYMPPIHPVGEQFRKGKNNVPAAAPGDVGSPWGIGSAEGGHKAIHPQLGTFDDFHDLLARARDHGLEIALDIAFQCAPDHPYVKEHPEWFRHRPDGSIRYAENPPKKYQDIYPIDFESENWSGLWDELLSVFGFWIEQGVRIFRVDNPHTKAFNFWEWCIAEIHRDHPDVLFLAEAFTRPKVMYRLAKLGYTQSYTYFTWRNSKYELTEYMTELTKTKVREFFRPNFWPNTPDILHAYLQTGGRPAFITRLVLAATLAASYGIYGPAFEVCDNAPKEPGSEEYLYAEKYEIKHWDVDGPSSLKPIITTVNQIRRQHPALQTNDNLVFHRTDNDYLVCYSKATPKHDDVILVIVNIDPHTRQWGYVDLALDQLGLQWNQGYVVHDLLTDVRFSWHGPRNYVELNPHAMPAHVLHIRR